MPPLEDDDQQLDETKPLNEPMWDDEEDDDPEVQGPACFAYRASSVDEEPYVEDPPATPTPPES